jgi:hypothetical protein
MPVDVVFVPSDVAVGPTHAEEVIVGLPLLDEDELDLRHIERNRPSVAEAARGTPVGEDA